MDARRFTRRCCDAREHSHVPALGNDGGADNEMGVRAVRRSWALVAAIAGLVCAAALGAASGAHADVGTPVNVSTFGCIVTHGGLITRPAGSRIVIHQDWAEQTLGIERDFLNNQTTTLSVNGGATVDVSGQWSAAAPFDLDLPALVWASQLNYDTGVTLVNPGDQMQFSFALNLKSAVPEVFNPAIGGQSGHPFFNGPGDLIAGTRTVTAT